MTLDSYFEVFESLSFQVQFSVLSGIQSVKRALARDETVTALMAELAAHPRLVAKVFERIRRLLPLTADATDLSYDESIVAYLYCLKRHDMNLAGRASRLIWDTGGLLWSCWLSYEIIEFIRQIEDSLDFASDAGGDSVSLSFAEKRELVDYRSYAATNHFNVAANHKEFAYPVEFSIAS